MVLTHTLQKLSYQTVLLKGFDKVLNIDNSLFTINRLGEVHGDETIDVVFQNPNLYGFLQDPKIAHQKKEQMKIADYFKYQIASLEKPNESAFVRFGVNIDIENWEEEMKEIATKFPKEYLFKTEHDIMKYHKQDIKGVNLPQLYMKV